MNHNLLANTLNILAIFYRCPPSSAEFQAIGTFFNEPQWQSQWSDLSAPLSSTSAQNISVLSQLPESDWKASFGIEYTLPAPPWGSVYLDPEHVIYGYSTQAYQDALALLNIQISTSEKEPSDHIGLILMVAAYMAANENSSLVALLNDHLNPWLTLYLDKLQQSTQSPQILAMAELTKLTINSLVAQPLD